jgi:hypothetical protein
MTLSELQLDWPDGAVCDPASGYGDPQRGIVGAYRANTEGK